MVEVVCPSCGKNNSVDGDSDLAVECHFCFEELKACEASDASNACQRITGLKLVYQINQQRIDIPASGRTVLGREAVGANVLSNIFFNGKQVVSRKHCSIEFRENGFYLQDEGSLNGTFYGANKIDCRSSPQLIRNGNLVYLGEEPFLAKVETESVESRIEKEKELPVPAPVIGKYRCNDPNCIPPFESATLPTSKVCPKCGNFDRFVAVTE